MRSMERIEKLQNRIENRLPTHYPGQNLETMGEENIRDMNDLKQQCGCYRAGEIAENCS